MWVTEEVMGERSPSGRPPARGACGAPDFPPQRGARAVHWTSTLTLCGVQPQR